MADVDHHEGGEEKIQTDPKNKTTETIHEGSQECQEDKRSIEGTETRVTKPDDEQTNEEDLSPDQSQSMPTVDANDKDESLTTENDDEFVGLVFGDDLDSQSRNLLFEKGVQFKRKGDHPRALHCFLSCLKGLQPGCQFTHLPECLHSVADIYSSEGDYENAIQFIQAEKIYYETALIEVSGEEETVSKEWESFGGNLLPDQAEESPSIKVVDPGATNPGAIRANEYEKLAIMCLRQKNVQLALEYSGKATKIRQALYGENHPVTVKSLDLFTTVYAEMGKVQYSAAMERFGQVQKKIQNEKKPEDAVTEEKSENVQNTTTGEEENARESLAEQRDESVDQGSQDNQSLQDNQETISITSGQALLIYFVVTVVTMLLVLVVCSYWIGKDIPWTYRYMARRLKFYYYYYIQNPFSKHKYF